MENILSQYTWAYRTNLAKNLLAPKDAVILLLKDGPVTRKPLIKALQVWRPRSTWKCGKIAYYTYLFNASYHNVAQNIQGDTSTNYRQKSSMYDSAFWYRPVRGTYALTLSGIKRLHQLGF